MKRFKRIIGLSIFSIGYILVMSMYIVYIGQSMVEYGDRLWLANGGKPL